jgi:hypothetical protein
MWLARTATAKAAVMAVALWPPGDAWGHWGAAVASALIGHGHWLAGGRAGW